MSPPPPPIPIPLPANPAPSPPSTPPPLRILMLHGYTQTPPLFRAKTRALAKSLSKPYPNLHLSYLPAPHRLLPADIPGHSSPSSPSVHDEDVAPEAYGWWRRKDRVVRARGAEARGIRTEAEMKQEGDEEVVVVYEGIEESLRRVANCIRTSGPFSGVIGFSQGATLAAMVASLLEGHPCKASFDLNAGMPYPSSFLGNVNGFVQAPLRFAVCYSGFRAEGGGMRGFMSRG